VYSNRGGLVLKAHTPCNPSTLGGSRAIKKAKKVNQPLSAGLLRVVVEEKERENFNRMSGIKVCPIPEP
jgi:hypothetical protein